MTATFSGVRLYSVWKAHQRQMGGHRPAAVACSDDGVTCLFVHLAYLPWRWISLCPLGRCKCQVAQGRARYLRSDLDAQKSEPLLFTDQLPGFRVYGYARATPAYSRGDLPPCERIVA